MPRKHRRRPAPVAAPAESKDDAPHPKESFDLASHISVIKPESLDAFARDTLREYQKMLRQPRNQKKLLKRLKERRRTHINQCARAKTATQGQQQGLLALACWEELQIKTLPPARDRQRLTTQQFDEKACFYSMIAQFYWSGKDAETSLALYRQAQIFLEAIYGPSSLKLAQLLQNIALIHRNTGNYELAFKLYQQSLEMHDACGASVSRPVAEILKNISYAYETKEDWPQAIAYQKRATETLAMLSGETEEMADCLHHTAEFYALLNDHDHALECNHQALKIYIKAENCLPKVAQTHRQIAYSQQQLGLIDEPLTHYRLALRILEGEHTLDPNTLANTAHNMATLADMQGMNEEAMKLYEKAIGIFELQVEHAPTPTHLAYAKEKLGTALQNFHKLGQKTGMAAILETTGKRLAELELSPKSGEKPLPVPTTQPPLPEPESSSPTP